MSRFKSRVARLEMVSADFGSAADLLILMMAARDGGAAIFAALSPAQQRAYREWSRSAAVDQLITRLTAASPDGST